MEREKLGLYQRQPHVNLDSILSGVKQEYDLSPSNMFVSDEDR